MTRNTLFAGPDHLLSENFPYVLWPITPSVYSLQPLPHTARRDAVHRWIADLSRALKRRAALVLSPSECVYFSGDGKAVWSNQPPTGGLAFRAELAIPQLPAECYG